MRNLSNFALFQLVWFACVLGAARGNGWIGPLAALAFAGIELALSRERARVLGYFLGVALLGSLLDTLLLRLGLTAYARAADPAPAALVPLWISALWLAFAALPPRSLAWLRPRPALAALLGALGGPLSFLGAARLGAVSLPAGQLGLVALALEWALLTPLLLALVPSPAAVARSSATRALRPLA